ncbi:hypothetical protein B0H14DRAFT_3113496 [Mycena olivaceomarginata]|nr:hypothetical protein B0H14DRAFT_3113496 [Mycena olivaceomarginata]
MSAAGPTAPRPSWPSLYNPGIELLHIVHHDPVQPGGAYLSHPFATLPCFQTSSASRLYWTLIFYTPIFLCCGLYGLHQPHPTTHHPTHSRPCCYAPTPRATPAAPLLRPPKPKPNEGRSRTTFALLVLLASVIIGFILAGVYKLAGFNLSTWIPFLWALISVLVGILSVWPSVIDII